MLFLSVDLASKFSAAMLRDSAGEVHWQGDSGGQSPKKWISTLKNLVWIAENKPEFREQELHMLVEDIPYGISNQAMTKPATRLQGMLMQAIDRDFYFINPSTWQKEYPGVARAPKGMSKTEGAKYRINAAKTEAQVLGYHAPDLVAKWQLENPTLKPLKKYTNPLEKQMTDYVDAFLINDWLIRHKDEYTTLTGVQLAMI